MKSSSQKIGFIGQGWIGKNMANDFENRGYEVVRYSLEEPYIGNKEKIATCDITFIAVPTPTTKDGFSLEYVVTALDNIGKGNIAVIKSTILPGSTFALQEKFSDIEIMYSPEFLREKFAVSDTQHPSRTILGVLDSTPQESIDKVFEVLPDSDYRRVMSAESAECVKYGANNFLYTKIVFFNLLHDLTQQAGGDWEDVVSGISSDIRIGDSHTNIFDRSGENSAPGRGAGGHCFIKDFEAMSQYAEGKLETSQLSVLESLRDENIRLLISTAKDLDLLKTIYGENE